MRFTSASQKLLEWISPVMIFSQNIKRLLSRESAKLSFLFAFSFLIRLAYIYSIRTHPLFRFPTTDAEAYDLWARAILGGDWLGKGVFYQDPFYPYFLAIFYACFGRNFALLASFQALLDSVGVVLLVLLGKRLFSSRAGWIAGLGAALYGVSVFYAGLFEKTSIALFFTVALLLACCFAAERPRAGIYFAAGVVMGLGVLVRGNLFLFVPMAFLWLAWVSGNPLSKRLLVLEASLAAGLAAVILPCTAHNWAVGHDFVLTTSGAGFNFYVGNSPKSTGWIAAPSGVRAIPRHEEEDSRLLAEKALGRALKPSEVSRYWFREGLNFIVRDPLQYLRLLKEKFLWIWAAAELPDAYDFYFFRQRSIVLRGLPLGFGLAGSLGIAGIFLLFYRKEIDKKRSLPLLFLAAYVASLLLFNVTGRYRLPLVPALLLFGAYALEVFWEGWQARRHLQLAAGILATSLIFAAMHVKGFDNSPAGSYFLTGNALYEHGRYPEALEEYRKALAGNEKRPELHFRLGQVLRHLGRGEESIRAFRKAAELTPSSPPAYEQLSQLYGEQGDRARSKLFEVIGKVYAGDAPEGTSALADILKQPASSIPNADLSLMAYAFYAQGRYAQAEAAWNRMLKIQENQPGVLLNLFVINEKNNPRQAIIYLRRYLPLAQKDPSQKPMLADALRRLDLLESRLRQLDLPNK